MTHGIPDCPGLRNRVNTLNVAMGTNYLHVGASTYRLTGDGVAFRLLQITDRACSGEGTDPSLLPRPPEEDLGA
jgi:hypothetical protein